MTGDDRAIRRSLRVKAAADDSGGRVDLGAIAAGLIAGIVAIGVAIAGPLPEGVGVGLLVLAIVVGSLVAGGITAGSARVGIGSGMAVVVATIALMILVSASTRLGTGDPMRIPLVYLHRVLSPRSFAVAVAAGVALGGLAGWLGHRFRH